MSLPLVNAADFRERVEQELARAQRYCLYLSLLVLDLSEVPARDDIGRLDSLPANLSENLKAVLRCSDLVAMPRGDQLVVLLVETPASGLAVVSDRVRNFVNDFLEGQAAAHLPLHTAVYPDTTSDFNRLLSSLQIRAQAIN